MNTKFRLITDIEFELVELKQGTTYHLCNISIIDEVITATIEIVSNKERYELPVNVLHFASERD